MVCVCRCGIPEHDEFIGQLVIDLIKDAFDCREATTKCPRREHEVNLWYIEAAGLALQ